MPIDGCDRSFEELAHEVLPTYMGRLRGRIANAFSLGEFAVRGVGPGTMRRRLGLEYDPPGCYVLIDGKQPVYVGISKKVLSRLNDHVKGSDHYTATLAYRIAVARYPHDLAAARAMQDGEFLGHFKESRDYLCSLNAAFVEIGNPLELYLFEPYAAMELDTGFQAGGWNTFETH